LGLSGYRKEAEATHMTSTELEKAIREALTSAGLWQAVDEYRSQFLEFPDGFFAEIVLNDGSKLANVESIVQEVEGILRKQGTELHPIVRANWAVRNVEGPRAARGAWAFPATLVSGGLTTDVEVDVDQFAIDAIRRKLVAGGQQEENAIMKEVVREFLNLQLSLGGESYWDPIGDPKQELHEGAFLYLLGHSTVGQR
jgi:hypothetical protein